MGPWHRAPDKCSPRGGAGREWRRVAVRRRPLDPPPRCLSSACWTPRARTHATALGHGASPAPEARTPEAPRPRSHPTPAHLRSHPPPRPVACGFFWNCLADVPPGPLVPTHQVVQEEVQGVGSLEGSKVSSSAMRPSGLPQICGRCLLCARGFCQSTGEGAVLGAGMVHVTGQPEQVTTHWAA